MKEIKEFADFSGTDGYVIVDGLTNADAGGKKLLSSIGGGGEPIIIRYCRIYNSDDNPNNNSTTLNGNTILPSEVIQIFKENPNIIVRMYRVWKDITWEEANLYPGNLDGDKIYFYGRFYSHDFSVPCTYQICGDADTQTWTKEDFNN